MLKTDVNKSNETVVKDEALGSGSHQKPSWCDDTTPGQAPEARGYSDRPQAECSNDFDGVP